MVGTNQIIFYICGAIKNQSSLTIGYKIMASVSLFIRSSKRQDSEVAIWLRYRNGRNVDIRVSTTEQIPARFWDVKREAIKSAEVPDKETIRRFNGIMKRLDDMRSLVYDLGKTNRDISPTLVREAISDYQAAQKQTESGTPSGILDYLLHIIPQMESGEFRHKGVRYGADTIRAWRTFSEVLRGFLKHYRDSHKGERLTWDKIDKGVCSSFLTYLQVNGYMKSSINKHVINFKALVNMALDAKVHGNHAAPKAFYKPQVHEYEKRKKIYLTETEVQALYEMDLEPGSLHDKVRDVFLCGCYTGQRISDYGRLTRENFTTTARGIKVVKLVQKKTGTSVTIPILNDNLLQIVKKHDGNIPRLHEQVVNKEIKVIMEELSETVPSLAVYEKTLLDKKERVLETDGKTIYERDEQGNVIKPRYEMVTTHTARRTALTNLYLTRLFDSFQLMHVSGHKTEKAFWVYIRLSSDEIAEGIDKILQKEKGAKINNVF